MKKLFVGQTASKTRVFSSADVAAYRELTGDICLDFARSCQDSTVVPGPMLGGLISDLLGTELPGRGTNWLKQRYDFKQPAIIDQEIIAAVEITRLRPDKALVNLALTISGATGEILCSGRSLVLIKDMALD